MDEDVFADDPMDHVSENDASGAGSEGQASGGGRYADELVSKKIRGRSRTFYVDLKQSSNGKFIKISELSRGGQRSTIMFDGEDLDEFIAAFQEIKSAM